MTIRLSESTCAWRITAKCGGVDFLEVVEEFFEEAGIEVEPEVVEKIADSVFHKGFCLWDGFQFEMLVK